MKRLCDKCDSIAVWDYAPGSSDRCYCENHVPRGCSCNEDADGNQPVDEKGREFPCVEYNYYEKGIEVRYDQDWNIL